MRLRTGLRAALRMACALAATGTLAPPAALAASSAPGPSALYRTFAPAATSGRLHYLASREPADPTPTSALIALHGHPRDARRTFDAALAAVPPDAATVVVAPVFQVAASDAGACPGVGVPPAEPGDALWTCASWIAGEPARGGGITAFTALDAMVAEVLRQWPGVRSITLAGFSAGAQLLQHSVGFAAAPPAGVTLRYVIADPGTWLYFDPVRPQPMRAGEPVDWAACESGEPCTLAFTPADTTACPGVHHWKYGTDKLPASTGRSADAARARYAAADLHYVEGELDDRAGPGTANRLLDRSCAAQAQGPFRRQRGLAYAAYDRALLAPLRNRQVTVAAGCAHDVTCVFAVPAVRALLLNGVHAR